MFGPIKLKPPLVIQVSMLIQLSERLCIHVCVLKISSLPLCTIFLLNFGNSPTLWYLLFGFGNKTLNIIRYRHPQIEPFLWLTTNSKKKKNNNKTDNEMHVPMPKIQIRGVIIILQHSVTVFNSLLYG